MATKVLMPKIGLTMQEGTIAEWLVAPGQVVHAGDALFSLDTDKVTTEVEAEAGGRFHPAVPLGVTLPPGALIGWLLQEGETPPSEAAPAGPEGDRGQAPETADTLQTWDATVPRAVGDRTPSSPNARRVARALGVDLTRIKGTGPGGRIVSEDVEEYAEAVRRAGHPGQEPAVPRPAESPTRIVSPLVRRHAERLGVDTSAIDGSGVGGRVTRADIEHTLGGATGARRSAGTNPRETTSPPAAGAILPFTGMRRVIARRMQDSLRQTAQLTHGYEARMDAVVAVREQLKRELADSGVPVPTVNDFVVKAAAVALRAHPLLNATVYEDHIQLHEQVHMGLAVAVPDGLLLPVIRDAADCPLTELAGRTRLLAERARAGRLTVDELTGATFAVTSLGTYGVDFFTPIINPGNVGILGVGRLRDGIAWNDDKPVRTRVLTLSLTFDHRAVDGAPAAEYLRTVTDLLQTPLRLLVG